jgi:hypothetical protein
MSSLQIRVRVVRDGIRTPKWYSVRLRFAILTDRDGLERFFDSVMLRSGSRESAFQLALTRGRAREQSYRNEQGVSVRWRLASIVSLDEIQEADLHGAELLGMPIEADRADHAFAWDHDFHPELSVPAETRA